MRNSLERATNLARKLLGDDPASQLEGTFDVMRSGAVPKQAGPHLLSRHVVQPDELVAASEQKPAAGVRVAEVLVDYLRDAAFTTLNRFAALKVREARELVTKGEQSSGYREFCGLATGVAMLPDNAGYRIFIATDGALAIAQGLEEVFWAEGSDRRRAARPTRTRTIEDIMGKRASPAVKSALTTLPEASPATRSGGRVRGGIRRSATIKAHG